MFEPPICPAGRHLAPATGGSCPCGMVTRIPAAKRPPAGPSSEGLAVLVRSLDEWSESLEAAVHGLLREHADRLAAALATTGLVLGAGDADRLVVPRIEAALLAAMAHTAPRAVATPEVVTPASENSRAPLFAVVDSTPGELDVRRAQVAASAAASTHAVGKADRKTCKKAGQKRRRLEAVAAARTGEGGAGMKPKRHRLEAVAAAPTVEGAAGIKSKRRRLEAVAAARTGEGGAGVKPKRRRSLAA